MPRHQARFDLSVIIPRRELPADPTLDDIVDSRLRETFRQRGVETIVDLGAAGAVVSTHRISRARSTGSRRTCGHASPPASWPTPGRPSAGRPSLVVGGRVGGGGPDFYFVHDVTRARRRRSASFGSRSRSGRSPWSCSRSSWPASIARGVLAPVEAASRAAERIERGDLSARVPVTSDDEFGAWAERFNRMAAALAETIARLETAEAQNRRFVADVAHELRTPLAALVAEASILREHLDALPPESRRAGELLVADVGRLRTLVDDLMELSRFDAGAEQVALEPVDLAAVVRVGRRGPPAGGRRSSLPDAPLVIDTDRRRLERILGNLLDNAREHAPGAPVEVSLAAGADEIVAGRRGPGTGRSRPTGSSASSSGSQGRPVASRWEQRARAGDRGRARRAARRVPRRREPASRRAAHRAAPACDRIVTSRRHGCDAGEGRWHPIVRTRDPAMKPPDLDRPRARPGRRARRLWRAPRAASARCRASCRRRRPPPPALTRPRPPATAPASSAAPVDLGRPRRHAGHHPDAHGRARQDHGRPRLLCPRLASRGSRVSCRSCGPCQKPPAWPGPRWSPCSKGRPRARLAARSRPRFPMARPCSASRSGTRSQPSTCRRHSTRVAARPRCSTGSPRSSTR